MSRSIQEILRLLPGFFAHHLLLSLTALALGLLISLPAAVLASRKKYLQPPLMGFANTVQTIPSLALLALMVPLLGQIGFVPALLALVLYCMLPVLRNTITGLANVDPSLIEAARGLGMTPWQQLIKVELPMAAPTIIAGIRTATVWVVGIATLATPVGQTSLGNFIFTGLQTQNQAAVVIGCVAAAGLALLLDGIIRMMELGSQRGSRRMTLLASAALAGVFVIGLAPLIERGVTTDGRPLLIVGAKTFTEQHVLAEFLADRFRDSGLRVATKPGMGSQLLFDALKEGAVDCYVDYSGTIWTNVMKREDYPGRRQMLVEMKRWLASRYNIATVGRLGFENTYCLAMRRDRARDLGVKSISDLQSKASLMRLGGDVEFFGRPEWQRAQSRYDLQFADVVGLDASIMYSAVKDGQVDVIAAFSSDGRISAFDLVVLDDDRQVFPPYDAIVLMSQQAWDNPEIARALQPVVMSIDDETMRLANKLVDVDGASPREAAAALWTAVNRDQTVSVQSVSDTPQEGTVVPADTNPTDSVPTEPGSNTAPTVLSAPAAG